MTPPLPPDLAQALDYERLRSWLHSQSGTVGISADACQCPLARYLQACGFEAEVIEDLVYFGEDSYTLPSWAGHFISGIDRQGRYVEIQALLALEVLNQALEIEAQAELDQ